MAHEHDRKIEAMAQRARDLEEKLREQAIRLDAALSAIGTDERARRRDEEPSSCGGPTTVPVPAATSRRDLFRTGAIDLGGRRGMNHMLRYLTEHPDKGLLG